MNVTVEFQYTRKEFSMAVNEFYFNKAFLGLILVIAFALIGLLLTRLYRFYMLLVMVSASSLAACFVCLYFLPNTIYESDPKYKSKYILTFSHDDLQGIMDGLEFKVKWGYFKKAQESRGFFYLLSGKEFPLAIPKRAFPSKVQEQVFRDIAQEKLGKIQKR
jgi:hypothetical protein